MEKLEVLESQIAHYMASHKERPFYVEYLRTKKYGYKKIAQNFIGENVLELGSDGAATSSILVRWSQKLTIVDVYDNISKLVQKDPEIARATFVQSLWEEFAPSERYSDILLTDSLEHVENPVEILGLIRGWLKEEGRLHIIVPNALALHRLIGVEMGLLESPYAFNANDIKASHKRVYDFETLRSDIEKAGLTAEKMEGVQLKFMTDTQLSTFPLGYKDALDSLSSLCDRHCAEIYACCKRG